MNNSKLVTQILVGQDFLLGKIKKYGNKKLYYYLCYGNDITILYNLSNAL